MSSGLSQVGRPIADRVIRYFLRRRPDATVEEAATFARVSLFTVINGLANLIYGIGFLALDRHLPGMLVIAVAITSFLGSAVCSKVHTVGGLRRIVHVVILAATLGLAAVAAVSGPLGELTPWFLCLCAAASVLLLGDATAVMWSALIMATIVFIPRFRLAAPSDAYLQSAWELPVSQAGLTLILVLYAVVTRRATEAQVDTLRTHDAELLRYVTKLEGVRVELEAARDAAEGARRIAEEANLAKSRFLANMTHELRTPLNAVIGYAEIISEDDEGSAAAGDARRIQRAGRQLLGLVDNLLDASKLEAGRADLHLSDVDIRQVAHDAAGAVRPVADENGNRLVVQLGDDLGKMHSDELRVRQILVNLLSNACKFTEEGDVTLEVERSDSHVVFRVHDTGIGMTNEQIERVFEPFRQADSSTTRRFGGTGLGLSIARNYSRLLGGELTLTSEAGRGTTSTATLPIESTDSASGEVDAVA